MDIAKYIDSTCLAAYTTIQDIIRLCNEAKQYNFKSVCVNPCFVKEARELLEDSNVLVCTVIGFPLGANTTDVKVYEIGNAILNGAQEVDVVINISKVKEHDWGYLFQELNAVRKIAHKVVLKVIIETCYLDDNEIEKITQMIVACKADFVKTSTGFGPSGAKISDMRLLKEATECAIGIKASGGIRTREQALEFIEAGATRIGTSKGKEIVEGE